jgi:hypothetical protein
MLVHDGNETWRRLVNIMKCQSQMAAGVHCTQLRKRRVRIENADDAMRRARGDELRHSRERTDEDCHRESLPQQVERRLDHPPLRSVRRCGDIGTVEGRDYG